MAASIAAQEERLPYGVGRFGAGWYILVAGTLAVVAWGLIAYSRQFTEGLVATGLRDIGTMGGAAWGLYIAFDVYFVGVSFAGITMAALIRLLNLEHMKPVSRMAEVLTVIALVLAGFSVLPDLGQPLRGVINLFQYARPQSPFFGTFTLVISGYLFASLVYLYLDGRRDAALCAQRATGALRRFLQWWAAGYRDTTAERARHARTTFWLALAILPLLVTAHSTLGFVFGIQSGRPGWSSALQAPAFVVLAGVSGVGHLIVLAAILRQTVGTKEDLHLRIFTWLGNLLMVLIAVYLYFTVVELLTSLYTGHQREVDTTMRLLAGEYAWLYWLSIASLVVPFALLAGQFLLRRYSLALLVVSGVLVNVAAVGKRVLTVVPSQTHGSLLPYPTGSYSPSWVEYSIIAGLLALGALLYAVFVKLFPIMEMAGQEGEVPAAAGRPAPAPARWGSEPQANVLLSGEVTAPAARSAPPRGLIAVLMVVGGFLLQAVSYFLLAAPWGKPTSPLYSNPRLPFAPSLFILGVMLVFLAAVVYELWPERAAERVPAAQGAVVNETG